MEFRDLKKQYGLLKNDIDEAILRVASSGNYIGGIEVDKIEIALAQYVNVKHCISCANGTDALSLALMAWGVGEGDLVFVPDFTFFASAEVVAFCGATPVFVDVKEDTFNIDTDDLRRKVEKFSAETSLKPKAVIAVDLFGLPADYQSIRAITDEYNLLLLEDGAQGFGGAIGEKKACSFGDISTTSFFPAKPLGCYGDGGAIFTNNDKWAELIRSFKVHGKGSSKYDNVRIGMNSRLDAIQAAVLSAKLPYFKDVELDAINALAEVYTSKLSKNIKTPTVPKGYFSSWAQYTIILKSQQQRELLREKLKNNGIPSMVYYPSTMHNLSVFKSSKDADNKCNIASSLCLKILSLPIHPYMASDEQLNIISLINDICNEK